MATGFHPPGQPASAPSAGGTEAVAFSAAAAAEIARIRQRYPTALAALIPTLFVAQREFGWLPDEVLELVATTLGVPATKVRSTATFYTMLKKEPTGRVHVQVCKNISCYLRRSDDVTATWEDELGIASDLETDMARVIGSYACEWRKAVEDPETVRRFRHFINSERPDDNVVFVHERGQIRPATPAERRARERA